MDRLNTELKRKAVSLGLCAQWTGEWTEKDKDELCEMYIRGLDFCIAHDYPKNEYMKYHFDGIMQKHGVYVDDKISIHGHGISVYNGHTEGEVYFDGYDVGTLHVRHDSVLTISAKGHSKVFVSVYDKAYITVMQSEDAKVYVYQKGGDVITSGDVLIRRSK